MELAIGLALMVISLVFGYLGVHYLWARIQLARYRKMLKTITPEEVHERAKQYMPWDGTGEPPLIVVWSAIVEKRKEEWIKAGKLSPLIRKRK